MIIIQTFFLNIRMSMNKITIEIFFKHDGTPAFDTLAYEYDPTSQEDMNITAAACATVAAKMKKLGDEKQCALGVRIKAPPEFQPYLMAAINNSRTSDWNVSVRGGSWATKTATAPGGSP